MSRFMRLLVVVAAVILQTTSAQAWPWNSCKTDGSREFQDYPQYHNYGDGLIPGVTWDAWRILLGRNWSAEERAGPWFSAAVASRAAALAPLDTPYLNLDYIEYGNYLAPGPVTAAQEKSYDDARALYLARNWPAAIAAFDTIASEDSPYAAAAAYSAARASLSAGNFDDGFRRVQSLVNKPAQHEMAQAAYDLVGTLANQTGASPLLAAQLEGILHLLMAPPDLRCGNTQLGTLARDASDNLYSMLGFAFLDDSNRLNGDWNAHERWVFAQVAADDPMADIIRTIAPPTSFKGGLWQYRYFSDSDHYPSMRPIDQDVLAVVDDAGLTAHARDRALATGNPLWAYALSRRTTNVADVGLIRAAIQKLGESGLSASDVSALRDELMVQEARVLMMAGRLDEGIAATQGISGASARQQLGNAGARYLVGLRDLASARKWAIATTGGLPVDLMPLLATNWQEVIADGMGQKPKEREPSPAEASVLDLLPADRLIALARTPGLSNGWRRPLLSAGWVRLFMLGRDSEFQGLFPAVRSAFPELTPMLDAIDRAWMPWTRRRMITDMILKLPGLSPRVLWARSHYRAGDLASMDRYNPSDGNWWCAIDGTSAQSSAFVFMFLGVLPGSAFWPTNDRLQKDWLGWHPLLRDVDPKELAQLSRVESGPRRLAEEAVAWAGHSNWLTRKLGMDRDLPETLALAVRATRYGCHWQGPIGDVSHAAWQALHKDFPDSPWTVRTPYWFNLGGPNPNALKPNG